jgi:hypothetical protein
VRTASERASVRLASVVEAKSDRSAAKERSEAEARWRWSRKCWSSLVIFRSKLGVRVCGRVVIDGGDVCVGWCVMVSDDGVERCRDDVLLGD